MDNKNLTLGGRLVLTIAFLLFLGTTSAQERIPSSSIYLQPAQTSNVTLVFATAGEGTRFTPTWGLDQAWISEQNMRKGINHMGWENIGIGRSCYRTTKDLVNDTDLAADPINYLRKRNTILNLHSETLPLVLTADQEAGVVDYYRKNGKADAQPAPAGPAAATAVAAEESLVPDPDKQH